MEFEGFVIVRKNESDVTEYYSRKYGFCDDIMKLYVSDMYVKTSLAQSVIDQRKLTDAKIVPMKISIVLDTKK